MSDPKFTCHFLDDAAFSAAENARMDLGKKRGEDAEWLKANNAAYGWASLSEIVAPCAMWYCPWLAEGDWMEKARADVAAGTYKPEMYLSKMYVRDWSLKRPPIGVLTPNGKEWCVDAKSSNGDGWTVAGAVPRITCAPSILVPGYHGFLRDGVFTPNM